MLGAAKDKKPEVLTYTCVCCGEKFVIPLEAEPNVDGDLNPLCDACAPPPPVLPVEEVFDGVVDSGERMQFEGGAVRDVATGKGRFDLMSPFMLKRLAVHYENGACKYADRNWEKGMLLHRFLESAMRHINDHMIDLLTGATPVEDHISAAIWNLGGYIHTKEMIRLGLVPASFDDLPKPRKDETNADN